MREDPEKLFIDDTLSPAANVVLEPPGRESVRGVIALVLLGIFVAELAYIGIAIPQDWLTFEQAKEVLSIALATTVGLLGAVIGFYFGSKR